MAGKIPRSFIDDLITRVDIVDLIHTRVPLKKAGREYVARCPFHNEKTPSFSVNRDKQVYHCFGCGASGNVISFLTEYEHLSFVESVEALALMQGLEIPKGAVDVDFQVRQQTLNSIYALQEKVAAFFSMQLRNHALAPKIVNYLKGREVSGVIAARYALGFAPPGWNNLLSEFDKEVLLQAGLARKKDNSNQTYDHFRDRLIFPIKDRRGRVLGFGGRVLDDSKPKYLNSPETEVFQKGKQVYGLYELLRTVSKPERILVVEGYMDVIAMAQHQIPYAVATLGTAMTEDQINLLFRHSGELVFCFDGDQAGRKAAWRALETALPCLLEGRQIRFMLLPDQQDPDSLIRSEGSVRFQARIAEAGLLSDYFFGHLTADLDLDEIEGRSRLVSLTTPLINNLPTGTFQQMMHSKLNELAKMQVSARVNSAPANHKVGRPVLIKRAVGRDLPSSMRMAITLLLQNPALSRTIDSELAMLLPSMPGGDLFEDILRLRLQKGASDAKTIVELFHGKPEARTVNVLAQRVLAVPAEGIEAEFQGACQRLLLQGQKKRLDFLIDKARQEDGLNLDEKTEIQQLLIKTNR